ncbi:hypothetical protein IR083_21025 [Dysgonomonas sp. GY75]|uniref:hypothetical protein n=1 Tax=Dysgonomonas sp. GY75 TaxID=2780419 RepID=UPI0018838BF5|nr:hypothetical protein [Dysgonomonas sp. GY75]MBF0651305.1 hypothetical protein [Dysgonomonas sp. GY75]
MNEIKASDIMLGNWFIGYDDKPFQWNLAHFGLLTIDGPTVDEIIKSPIHLTEEIVLKCGARKVKHIDGYSFWTFSGSKINKAHINICVNKTCYYGYSVANCEYLHQLQNLFKILTGNDLNIQL